MITLHDNRLFFALLITSLSLFTILTGCDNPADSEEEHAEPVGMAFVLNGSDLVTQAPNNNNQAEVSGEFSVNAGEETALVTAYFIDEDGNRFQPDEPEYTLAWNVANDAVAEIEQHSGDGKWSFHVHGASAGNTTVTFMLMHDGHSDFDTLPLPITVN